MERQILPAFLRPEYVAAVLDIPLPTLYQMARENRLPFAATHFGRLVRFKRAEVEAFVGEPLVELVSA